MATHQTLGIVSVFQKSAVTFKKIGNTEVVTDKYSSQI